MRIDSRTQRKLIAICMVAILLAGGLVIWLIPKEPHGLHIDKAYIKSVSDEEAKLNDVYVSTMANFATKCENNTIFRTVDIQNRLSGVTIFCRETNSTFTFWYSDKWRRESYGKE